jgi:hypothetical protein
MVTLGITDAAAAAAAAAIQAAAAAANPAASAENALLSDLRRRTVIPAFAGDRDTRAVSEFLTKLQDVMILYHGVDVSLVFGLIRNSLHGVALRWFSQWCAEHPTPTPQDIMNAFEARFLPADAVQRAKDQLARHRQGNGPAGPFIDRFNEIALAIPRAPGLNAYLVEVLTRNIAPAYRIEVRKAARNGAFQLDELQAFLLDLDDIYFGDSTAMAPTQLAPPAGPTPMEGVVFHASTPAPALNALDHTAPPQHVTARDA